MINLSRRTVRGLRVILHLTLGLLICYGWLAPVARLSPRLARCQRTGLVRWWMRQLAAILGVRVALRGAPASGAVLFVANHVSWLDIPCLLGGIDAVFVAKRDVAAWPILGKLAACGGTIFLERGHGAAATTAIMSAALTGKQAVVIFPEGTSTDGSDIRPFHPRLFQAAMPYKAAIQPIAIRYPYAAGPHIRVPFVGEDSFVPHLWRLLGEKCINAELYFLPILAPGERPRRAVAEYCRANILAVLNSAKAQTCDPDITGNSSGVPLNFI